MCSRPQFTDLTYMGGTGPCGTMTIIFGSIIKILHIKFGATRSFHVPKIPIYRFGLYGRYQILCTDMAIAKFEVGSSLRSDAIVITTNG